MLIVIPLLILLLLLLLLLLALGVVLSFRFTRRSRPDTTRSPAEYGLEFQDISFRTADGLTLRGWWIPAPGAERAVIFLHRQGGSMDPDVQYVPAFHAAGFSVLMFDFRAHGRSEGQVSTVGYLERQDALAAIAFVKEQGIERIGLLGFSMGGVVATLTTPLTPDVRAVISDGGPARMQTALRVRAIEMGVPRPFADLMAWLIGAITSLRVGAGLFYYEPVRQVGKIAPRPILFIRGERDQYVPPADFEALLAAAGEPKEVWRVPEAGHRTVDEVYPEEYRRRVVGFLEKWV
jgi:fermentation-respiration switch protein FrsA (DUF1100 family)